MAWWKVGYLDVVLISLAVLFPAAYHLWLWRAVRRRPLCSTVGINTATRRLWVFSMMKDNEKKAMLVVQSIRNVVMGSTLVGATSILLCTGAAAVLSSTSAAKKPLSDAVFGAHGATAMAIKYVVVLGVFLLAFLCHSLAICTLNQATFLVNALSPPSADDTLRLPAITRDYVVGVLERGFLLSLGGNKLFFAGAPLLLWVFGPVLPCLCSAAMIPLLHSVDKVEHAEKRSCDCEADARVDFESDQRMQV